MKTITSQPLLIIEDSRADFQAMSFSLAKAGLSNQLVWIQDGDEALDYLFRRGAYTSPESSPMPGLVLLDLNLPGTDGREVLLALKQDPRTRSIPVIVLTTSSSEKDIEDCYAIGANSYIVKPVESTGFFTALKHLRDYWFEVVILPKPK